MLYNLEQIRRRCDKKISYSIPKNLIGKRTGAYPRNVATTYLRKWDFRDVPVEILAKYDLEPKEYYYCGSHNYKTQKDRDYQFFKDITVGSGSKELKEFFVGYVNYYINEKKENMIEVVERFLEAEKMKYFTSNNKINRKEAEKLERLWNDKYLVLEAKGEPIIVLSKSPKDTTLILDKENNKLTERKGYEGEYKNNIMLEVADMVVNQGIKEPNKINEFTSFWFENVEFKEVSNE